MIAMLPERQTEERDGAKRWGTTERSWEYFRYRHAVKAKNPINKTPKHQAWAQLQKRKPQNLCICLCWALVLAHKVLPTIQLSTHELEERSNSIILKARYSVFLHGNLTCRAHSSLLLPAANLPFLFRVCWFWFLDQIFVRNCNSTNYACFCTLDHSCSTANQRHRRFRSMTWITTQWDTIAED